MKKILARSYYLQIFLVFILCLIAFLILGSNKNIPQSLKYKGAVLAHIHDMGSGYGSDKSKKMQDHLASIGYNSIQLNTFGYMKSSKHTEVLYKLDPTMSKDFVSKEIRSLKSKGFKVMLKPHIWIGNLEFDPDNWRNKIDFDNEKELDLWFKNYKEFILYEAKIAEEHNVEIFVIGTELVELTKYDDSWRDLIKSVRSVYNGKLTYAAEGLKAENISFWDDLDYIGIDAYFPLSNKVNPNLDELRRGWNKTPVLSGVLS